ncbi:hypothetical protein jhhlp_002377 [Lomentospora prolificans]|uniref:Uncharacterized protein n=1 Tax=Lomentospora prolificans TaxID=41688 RepID=A0A2N3NE36_9PEZI|nr:hypothetical protein jhhlp_002377 [Lomentospora prolificans]
MASKRVSALKFVGTVSVGLLTPLPPPSPRLAPLSSADLPPRRQASSSSTPSSPPRRRQQRPLEASYDVLGDMHSDGGSASVSGEDADDDQAAAQQQNGEEVTADIEIFLKERLVQTSLAALSFVISVVGIWGDGAA